MQKPYRPRADRKQTSGLRPYKAIVLSYLFGMLILTLVRVTFLATLSDGSASDRFWDVVIAFLIGLRFDQLVILVLLLPVIAFLPWLWRWSAARAAARFYLALTYSVIILVCITDIRYYTYFDSHVDFRVIEYFGADTTFWHLATADAMFYIGIFGWLGLIGLVYAVLRRIIPGGPVRTEPLRPRHFVFFVVLALLAVGGIRGRLGRSPLNWGQAYFTDNHFINQLGLNGPYTLARAWTEESFDPRLSHLPKEMRFPFVPLPEAIDSVVSFIGQPSDTWLEPGESLLRQTTQPPNAYGFQPNVIMLVMESFSGRNCTFLGARTGITPEFDRLASKGLFFTNIYSSGVRTGYGLAATLCSFPSLPGRSLLTRYRTNKPFVAIPEILKERSYYNLFAYGGDLAFDNMRGFFGQLGYDRFIGDSDFDSDQIFGKWGASDEALYQRFLSEIDSLPRPFNAAVLTISNHEPFDLPDSSVQIYRNDADSSAELNAMRYADMALGKFVDSLEAGNHLDSTLLILVADHCRWRRGSWMLDYRNFRIPLLMYSPPLLGDTGRIVDKIGSQIDILPTVLSLLGGSYEHASFGRNLLALSSTDPGYAMINVLSWVGLSEENGIWYGELVGMDSMLAVQDSLYSTAYRITDSLPDTFIRLQRKSRLILQVAEQLSSPEPVVEPTN